MLTRMNAGEHTLVLIKKNLALTFIHMQALVTQELAKSSVRSHTQLFSLKRIAT